MLVFAAETSCDETSICLMENSSIVEHITFSQEIHKIHGGVVPELACLLYTSPSPRDGW